jgi:hypothetical protein
MDCVSSGLEKQRAGVDRETAIPIYKMKIIPDRFLNIYKQQNHIDLEDAVKKVGKIDPSIQRRERKSGQVTGKMVSCPKIWRYSLVYSVRKILLPARRSVLQKFKQAGIFYDQLNYEKADSFFLMLPNAL